MADLNGPIVTGPTTGVRNMARSNGAALVRIAVAPALVLGVAFWLGVVPAPARAAAKPNLVIILADEEVIYDKIIQMMDACKSAGFDRVALSLIGGEA